MKKFIRNYIDKRTEKEKKIEYIKKADLIAELMTIGVNMGREVTYEIYTGRLIFHRIYSK